MSLDFTVHGVPVPQGSKTRWGSEDNPHTASWRQSVAEVAAQLDQIDVLHGPVMVVVDFYFPRPKAHYRSGRHAHELRADAPFWVEKTPDLDKLQRAIGDALTGVLLRDDSQIACWLTRKVFGAAARAEVSIVPLVGAPSELPR